MSAPDLRDARLDSDFSSPSVSGDEDKPVRCLKFRQQELWALKPVWSPKCVAIMYYLVAFVFIPIGIAVLVTSLRMSFTDRLRYDNIPDCDVGTGVQNTTKTCVVAVTLERDLPSDSYMYYGLVNYFQNSRNYIKSRSAEQLRGNANPTISDCNDGGFDKVVPCGLTANSFFNDSFILCKDEACTEKITLEKKGIAWDIDVNQRFKAGKLSDGYTEESNALVEDEDFMVWMRLATYNNFHKLYRIIKDPLPAGEYYVQIQASYPVEQFSGQKFIFLSETKWFGGRSRFLGLAYIIIGGISFVMATLFLIRAGTAPQAEMPPETTIPRDGYRPAPESSDAVGGQPVDDGEGAGGRRS